MKNYFLKTCDLIQQRFRIKGVLFFIANMRCKHKADWIDIFHCIW